MVVGRDAGRLIALVVAAEVGRDDTEVRRQGGELVTPRVPALGEPVQEDDERSVAVHRAVQADAVGLDHAVLNRHRVSLAGARRLCQCAEAWAKGPAMSLEFVHYEKRDHVAFITMNRPDVMNALHPPAHEELDGLLERLRGRREDTWVAVVDGRRRSGVLGRQRPQVDRAARGPEVCPAWRLRRHPRRVSTCGSHVIAAVNGVALGGGLEIALVCDVIVAAEHATLGLPGATGRAHGGGGAACIVCPDIFRSRSPWA